MTSLQESFEKAAEQVKVLKQKPGTAEMTELYGLYKQAMTGDNNIACPGPFNLTGRAKWNAWEAKKGVSKEEAMAAYVNLVNELEAKDGN